MSKRRVLEIVQGVFDWIQDVPTKKSGRRWSAISLVCVIVLLLAFAAEYYVQVGLPDERAVHKQMIGFDLDDYCTDIYLTLDVDGVDCGAWARSVVDAQGYENDRALTCRERYSDNWYKFKHCLMDASVLPPGV